MHRFGRAVIAVALAHTVGAPGCGEKRSARNSTITRDDGAPSMPVVASDDDVKRDPPADAGRPPPERHTWSGPAIEGIDRTRLNPMTFLPRAHMAAREQWSDAELLALQYVAVDPADGTCELTPVVTGAVGTIAYGFRRRDAPARGELECVYWVFIDHESVYDETRCEPEHRLPAATDRSMQCSLQQVLERVAKSDGEPTGRVNLVFWGLEVYEGNTRGRWRVSGYPTTNADGRPTSLNTHVVDDCE